MQTLGEAYNNYSSAQDRLEFTERDLQAALLQKMRDEIEGFEDIEECSVALVEERKILLTAYFVTYDGVNEITLHTDIDSDTIILYF